MKKIKLKQPEKLTIEVVHQMNSGEIKQIDLYFSLPKEMGINAQTLSSSQYFNAHIKGRRSYYTKGLHLPLLHNQFENKQIVSQAYKANLNLHAYQYIKALHADISDLLNINSEDPEIFYDNAVKLVNESVSLLKAQRENIPKEEELKNIFSNVDNYLSWYTEQAILKILMKKSKWEEGKLQKEALVQICSNEHNYRLNNNYNSPLTIADPNRISNKMRLLRRFIEYGVILNEEETTLGKITYKLVKGISTTVIMIAVLALVIKTRGALNGLTFFMVLALSAIYGIREIFKEDLKNLLWDFIRKGKPKWSRILKDPVNRAIIAQQKIWLDYIDPKKLPLSVKDLLARRHIQNKQGAQLLHYRIKTSVSNERLLSGYTSIEERISFSLRPFTRFLEQGRAKILTQDYKDLNSKIQKTSIERRHQIYLVIITNQGRLDQQVNRYKIILSRSGIIELEQELN